MMIQESKPELVVISQNLLGGGTSFNRNMLAHFPTDVFRIRCIYLNLVNWNGAKAQDIRLNPDDVSFTYGNEPVTVTAAKLAQVIGDTEGAVVSNLETELISLDLHPNRNKTVYFICHDDGFLPLAIKYQSLIDVFIAHNITVYNDLLASVGKRNKDIFFIQHGVKIPSYQRLFSRDKNLRLVFLARHYTYKGIYDLPVIDQLLRQKGIQADWTILGDGPERASFMEKVEGLSNFRFYIPPTAEEVLEILKEQDVFILPSRMDGLPVALLESMSVGCVPVIGNFSEGIKKVVSSDIGFVLPAGENELFAEKIALLAENRQLLEDLSANSVRKIKEEFDIEKQAMEYFKLYSKYRQFKKNRAPRLADLTRKLGYNENYNKLKHVIKTFRIKLFPKTAE